MDVLESEVGIEALLSTLVDGVIIIDAFGTMKLVNPACRRMFGYEAHELLGDNVKKLMPEPYHSEHDGYLKSYSDTHEKKIIGVGREVEGRRKDGSVFPLDLSVGEVKSGDGSYFIGTIRDLTFRHSQRVKFEQLQEEHFHLSRVSAMNEMGSAIAHELNQPLAASINYLETAKILLAHEQDADKDRLLDITSRAIEQIHRASEIIARMRGFIEKGDVEKSAKSLSEIVETARRLTFLSFSPEKIEVTINIPNSLPLVFVNNIQIQQVLINLLKNACEAMTDSQVKKIHIEAAVTSCGKFIEIQIKDTGIGLSDADIETLFVPFSSGKSDGMGVGLSISQSIITHHNGQIWARPNEPLGSVFHFTLPIAHEGRHGIT